MIECTSSNLAFVFEGKDTVCALYSFFFYHYAYLIVKKDMLRKGQDDLILCHLMFSVK